MEANWARLTLRVWDIPTDVPVADSLIGIGAFDAADRSLYIEATGPEEPLLNDLLTVMEKILTEHHGALVPLAARSTVDLFVGWTPMPPQEAATFTRQLLRFLGELDADIVFDTYVESEDPPSGLKAG